MRYIIGRLVGNFFASSSVAPKGATYSIIEEIDPITQKGIGIFFLANEQDVTSVKIGEGENACGFRRAPANFELLIPHRVDEPSEDRGT